MATHLEQGGAHISSTIQQAQIVSISFVNNETTYENEMMENIMELSSDYLTSGLDSNTSGDKARDLSVPLLGIFVCVPTSFLKLF